MTGAMAASVGDARPQVVNQYLSEKLAEICGVPAEQIREAARTLCTGERAPQILLVAV